MDSGTLFFVTSIMSKLATKDPMKAIHWVDQLFPEVDIRNKVKVIETDNPPRHADSFNPDQLCYFDEVAASNEMIQNVINSRACQPKGGNKWTWHYGLSPR